MVLKVGIQPAKHKVLTVLPSSVNVNECQATLIHVVTGKTVNLTHTDFSCPEVCVGFFIWKCLHPSSLCLSTISQTFATGAPIHLRKIVHKASHLIF